jgi:hypothetical protein
MLGPSANAGVLDGAMNALADYLANQLKRRMYWI